MSPTIEYTLRTVLLGEERWYEHVWTMRDFGPDEEFDPSAHFWTRSAHTKYIDHYEG